MTSAYKQFFFALLIAILIGIGSGVTSVYLFRSLPQFTSVAEEEPIIPPPTPPQDIRSQMAKESGDHFSRGLIEKEENIGIGTLVKLFYPDQVFADPHALKWEDLPPGERQGITEIWFVQGTRPILLDSQQSYGNCGNLEWYYDTVDRSIATIKSNGCGLNFYEQTITIFNPSGGKMATLYQGPSTGMDYRDTGNLYILFEGFSHTIYQIMADVDMAPCYENEKNASKFKGITITSLRNGVTKSKTLFLTNGTFSCAMGPVRLSPMSFYDDIISFTTPVGDMIKIDLQALYTSAMGDTDWTKDDHTFGVERVK